MIVVRDLQDTHQISNAAIRELVQQRINDLGGEEFDTTELGYILVVASGDTLQALETQLGFSMVANRITGIRWDQPGFTPSFEFIEDLGFCYSLVVVLSDSGYAVEVLIGDKVVGDVDLLAMCVKYATPPFPDEGPP